MYFSYAHQRTDRTSAQGGRRRKAVRTRFGRDPWSVSRVACIHFFCFSAGVDKTISRVFPVRRYFFCSSVRFFFRCWCFLLISYAYL